MNELVNQLNACAVSFQVHFPECLDGIEYCVNFDGDRVFCKVYVDGMLDAVEAIEPNATLYAFEELLASWDESNTNTEAKLEAVFASVNH